MHTLLCAQCCSLLHTGKATAAETVTRRSKTETFCHGKAGERYLQKHAPYPVNGSTTRVQALRIINIADCGIEGLPGTASWQAFYDMVSEKRNKR